MNTISTPLPHLIMLSQTDKERMHGAIVELLERVGMYVYHSQAKKMLLEDGARQNPEGRICLSSDMLQKALASAPENVPVYNREGELVMDLGDRRAYFGTGSDLWYQLDLHTGKRRISVLEDVARAARLAQALPNLDFVMTSAHASDVAPEKAYLAEVSRIILNTEKPMVHIAKDLPDLAAMWEMACIVRGGEEEASRRPYMIHYAEPTSPLKHGEDSMAKLLFCAEKGIPVIYSPAPLAGSTAPITVAGHVAQGLAECMFGLVLHQLASPGAPFIMGMGAAVLDMVTTQSSYNAPEYYLGYLAAVEMCHYFNLPSFGYAGTTDSQIPDGQGAFESGLVIYLSSLIGANLNHDVGYLDFGRTGALEAIVMGDEFISQARRFMRGVPVNDDTLALDVIEASANGQQYLTNPHTLGHCRTEQWRPGILNRFDYEKWSQAGGLDLREAARKKAMAIMQAGVEKTLDEAKAGGVLKVLEDFQA